MSYSTVFSIMVKPPGFFFRGGHSDSDDESIFMTTDELDYGPPSEDLRDMMESRNLGGGSHVVPEPSLDDFDLMFDGGTHDPVHTQDFDALFDSVVDVGTVSDIPNIYDTTLPGDYINMTTVADVIGGDDFSEMFE